MNYAHLLADQLELDLTDVTYSGATAAGILDGTDGRASGEPPQIEAVTAETALVTITGGGNDVGYVGFLSSASRPWPLRRVQPQDPDRFDRLSQTFDRLTQQVADRAPHARVFLVDYLTILPPAGHDTGLLPAEMAERGREIAARLAAETRAAAERAGCGYIAVSEASASHHAWSQEPWTRRYRIAPLGGAPYHPNAAGMTAVAELLRAAVG